MIEPPKELTLYRYLRGRYSFTNTDLSSYQNIKKGYKGEQQFDRYLKQLLHNEYLQLNSLLLEHKGTIFQLDSLLLFRNELYLFEIKNYQGEFIFHQDHLHCYTSDKNYRNPLHQLQRSTLLLNELLLNMGARFQIKPFLIFINPAFTLFDAKREQPIILPTQVNAFIKRLNNIQGKISDKHRQIFKNLSLSQLKESPFTRLPDYDFTSLKKGILCNHCRGIMGVSKHYFYCSGCEYHENKNSGILRHIIEFSILFPESNITTGIIHEWIGEQTTKMTIRKVMTRHMNQIKKSRYTHYIFR